MLDKKNDIFTKIFFKKNFIKNKKNDVLAKIYDAHHKDRMRRS